MSEERTILSVNKLAYRIGVSRQALEEVAKNKTSFYKPYMKTEKKRDGTTKARKIDNPNNAIRKIQKQINKKLLKEACKKLPTYMSGSIPKRGTVNNAKPHLKKQGLLLLDISDCFPSIHSSQVYAMYKHTLGCSPPVAKLLTKLTTYGDRIPQGAPTSPSLCNLILAPLAAKLNKLAHQNNLSFTQYVDDLTFSGDYSMLLMLKEQVAIVIEKEGFKVNRKKLKLVRNNERMEVTGLVVNQSIGVGRRYLRKVQRDIMKRKLDKTKIRGKIAYVGSVSKSNAKKLSKKLEEALNKD